MARLEGRAKDVTSSATKDGFHVVAEWNTVRTRCNRWNHELGGIKHIQAAVRVPDRVPRQDRGVGAYARRKAEDTIEDADLRPIEKSGYGAGEVDDVVRLSALHHRNPTQPPAIREFTYP